MKSFFKGAGANILRGVSGAGVLALYERLQLIVFGKKYGGGEWLNIYIYKSLRIKLISIYLKIKTN